jgi:polar amino acid transport system substrate-binding protein
MGSNLAMKRRHWIQAALAGLALGGCAGIDGARFESARASLAPTGRLRVAFLASPLYATRQPATGALAGVAVDLGRELARRIGTPFEAVVHTGVAPLMAGARTGEWDVALMGITPERAATMDFSAPYVLVEWGVMTRAGAPVTDASAIDFPGVRIGVVERASADALLTVKLVQASLVRAPSVAELYALLDGGRADVIVATKATLLAARRDRPGTRVLDGRVLVEPIGMAVPVARDAAAARAVRLFVEQAKAEGLVAAAIERAGLLGVIVAPAA